MKKATFYILFPIAFCLYHMQARGQQVCKEDLSEWEAKQGQALEAFAEHNTPEFAYDVTYYRAYWEINPAFFYIKGYITMYYKPTSSNFDKLGFDFNSSSLSIDSVVYHRSKPSFVLEGQNIELLVNLPKAAPIGQVDSITVYYQGAPYNNQESIVQGLHNNVPDIWTLSEPYGARDWWPCKQSLTDKADSIDIFVKTPLGEKAASNGLLVSSLQHDSTIIYHWKHRYPIATYLIGIDVTNFSEYNFYAPVGPKPGDSLLVMNYVYPEDSALFYAPSLQAKNAMALYVKLFGRYPFDLEKYGQAEFDYGGGMEHQTMTFLRDMDFSLVSHEMAHHWFGDKVTCGSWKDIWLNEGFAVFCEGQAEKYVMGSSAWRGWITYNLGIALQQISGSVYVDDTTSVSRIFSDGLTYCKGAYLLRMLEFMMGDSAFFNGCRSYLNDKNLAYAFANSIDLQNHLEAASGLKLDSFFNEWLYGQGYPLFNIYWKQANKDLKITLVQKTTSSAVPFFHIPVPIRITMDGRDTTFNLYASTASQDFNIPISSKIDSLVPDPDQWLLATYSVFPLDSLPGSPVVMYPNPARTVLSVGLHVSDIANNGTIAIYDMRGRELIRQMNISANNVEIPVANLANGVYLLKFIGKSTVFQGKFIKL